MYKGFILYLAVAISTNAFATENNLQNQSTGNQPVPEKSLIKNDKQVDVMGSSDLSATPKEKTSLSASYGQYIYKKNCMACHGADGKGVAPTIPDFTQKDGVLSKPSDVLFRSIKLGIGSMLAKGGNPTLTDLDLKAALDYIQTTFTAEQKSGCSQEIQLLKQQLNILNQKVAALETNNPAKDKEVNTTTTSNSLVLSKEKGSKSLSSGQTTYQKNCMSCHGTNGKGIAPTIPDLTKKDGVLSKPSSILLNSIKQGVGSMPAKGGNPALTDQDLENALDYIKNTFISEQKATQLPQQSDKAKALETTKSKEQAPSSTTETTKGGGEQTSAAGTSYFWPEPDISSLITGAASAGYSVPKHASGRFDVLEFDPMLSVRYKDLLLMHADLDFSLDEDGFTETELGNLNLNLFVNDFVVLGVGEFDSPIGYFVQFQSPSWINRLPTAPVGFDSDEAAPQSQLGAQLRGGFSLSKLKVNYITFVANGPRAMADPTTGFIDFIATNSFPNNFGNFMGGGRIGILPIPNLEIGFSGAGGKLALFDVNTNLWLGERGRDYRALGADLSFKWKDWDLRGEVIEQQIGPDAYSLFPQKANWKAWYLQAAYWFLGTKLQPVVRWGGYTSPLSTQSQHQVALGVDYWFAPSIAVQAAYQDTHVRAINEDIKQFIVQLVYGF
ncbi:Cytochrome c555 [Legionella pneumophila]|uniref:c-type cytochrome n=1 Tax=Legionella pneumophila TaxID=446 RepID=UPI000770A1C6|nr:c-type cytochrome [Legionella pneumophila]HAT8853867.1 c-type cytochrome [Legionella pneumophila subsp. pneumophila]MCZ4726493.1 c-type cytochrome [Legionella pneumophila]CZI89104.1 Cytochrome c555 [Legionella pneumophila]CZJ25553.1 Cytochrome c555 [Legionella pneumophila]CZJ28205.1 Cytochrome c555 [Legionella pneumophila]